MQLQRAVADAQVQTILVLSKSIDTAMQVPQCQPMARQLLQKTSGADSIETCSVDDENPHYQVTCLHVRNLGVKVLLTHIY